MEQQMSQTPYWEYLDGEYYNKFYKIFINLDFFEKEFVINEIIKRCYSEF